PWSTASEKLCRNAQNAVPPELDSIRGRWQMAGMSRAPSVRNTAGGSRPAAGQPLVSRYHSRMAAACG
ncbi:MAG: hypothetical protein ACKO2L_04030, partial [Planctomycetaceae bacterium]